MNEIDLIFYKITVYSKNFNCNEYRYGTNADEVIKRLMEEYKRYEDSKFNLKVKVEEIKDNRVKIKIKINLNFRE